MSDATIVWFEDMGRSDVARFGGKNASLGEMIRNLSAKGVAVPGGFATSADAYRQFVHTNGLRAKIAGALDEMAAGKITLAEAGQGIRAAFLHGDWPPEIAAAIRTAYRELARRSGRDEPDVAVRSSATAEDLPDASFAGQQETFLNMRGEDGCSMPAAAASPRCSPIAPSATVRPRDSIISRSRCRSAFRSMVRSDLGGAGVMFSIDTETGFRKRGADQCGVGAGRECRAGHCRAG